MYKFFLQIAFLTLPGLLFSQTLLRGPYLQSLSESGVKIMWRTDVPSNAVVRIGTSPDNLTEVFTADSLVTDHIVQVSGLSTKTKYYYNITSNSVTLAGGDEWHHFTTPPAQGSREKIRFWALGDFGKRSEGQRNAKNAFVDYTMDNPADFWVWLGDNCYDSGEDQEYQDKVFDRFYGYDSIFRYMPFYPLPGNHDYGSVIQVNEKNHKGPYYNIVEVFKNGEMGGNPSGTENYYSFNWGNVHFINFNSEIYSEILAPNTSRMMKWLKEDLENNTSEWTVVSFHQPPYSKGSHDSDDFYELIMISIRGSWLPVFEQYGVDLVLNGHSHVFERSYLMKGHYGRSPSFKPDRHAIQYRAGDPDVDGPYLKYIDGDSVNVGTVYVVSGNGGSSEDEATMDHPAMYTGDAGSQVCGSMIIDVEGNRMDVRYLKSDGTIGDHFAIEKVSSDPSAVNDLDASFDYVKAYPNPVTDKLFLDWSLKEARQLVISLIDLSGREVTKLSTAKYSAGAHTMTVDLKSLSLPYGQYYVNFRGTDGKTLTKTLVKVTQ